MFAVLKANAEARTKSGSVQMQFHAEIENGYFTGYEMLHGTDAHVGDFQIFGMASVSGNKVTYSLT